MAAEDGGVYVVGAGLAGLRCARRLHEQGVEATVLETDDVHRRARVLERALGAVGRDRRVGHAVGEEHDGRDRIDLVLECRTRSDETTDVSNDPATDDGAGVTLLAAGFRLRRAWSRLRASPA